MPPDPLGRMVKAFTTSIKNLDRRLRLLETREVKLQDWQTPTLAGAWANTGSGFSVAGYYKQDGVVHLRGNLSSGTGTIFTLPVGYRPQYQIVSGAVATGGGQVQISTSGVVSLTTGTAPISLDGLSFRAFG